MCTWAGQAARQLTPAWKVEGDLQAAAFGAAVAGAGYVNGDEYADVIVGMPGYTNGDFTNAGAAFVYFGSEDGLNTGLRLVGLSASRRAPSSGWKSTRRGM